MSPPPQTQGHWLHDILQAKTWTLGWPSMDQMLKHNAMSNIKSIYMVAGWMGGAWALLMPVWCLSAQGMQRESSHLSAAGSTWPWLPIMLVHAPLLSKFLSAPPSVWLQEWVMLTASLARCCRPPEVEQNECSSHSALRNQNITLVGDH